MKKTNPVANQNPPLPGTQMAPKLESTEDLAGRMSETMEKYSLEEQIQILERLRMGLHDRVKSAYEAVTIEQDRVGAAYKSFQANFVK